MEIGRGAATPSPKKYVLLRSFQAYKRLMSTEDCNARRTTVNSIILSIPKSPLTLKYIPYTKSLQMAPCHYSMAYPEVSNSVTVSSVEDSYKYVE